MGIDNSIIYISIIVKFVSLGLPYHIISLRRQNIHLIDLSNWLRGPIFYLNQNSPTIEVIHNDVKPFFTKQQRNFFFSRRPLNAKIHMIFLVFSGDQKYGINENNFGKTCFGSRFYFSKSWPIYNKSPHLSAQAGAPNKWTHDNMTLWTTKHNHNLYEDFRGFAEVALRNIRK